MRRFTLFLPFLLPPALAAAQANPLLEGLTATPKLEAYKTTYATTLMVNAAVQVLPGEPVALFASWPGAAAPFKLVATATADPLGKLLLSAPFKPELMPEGFELTLTASVLRDGEIVSTHSTVAFGVPPPVGCERLDFDFTLGQDEPVKGEPLGLQWADVGLVITTQNNVPGHPDLGIIFDSAAVTGGDFDLATPGPGLGNDTPLGKLMIVAENNIDSDSDGLVDEPDDEAGGGVMRFDFQEPWDLCSITLVDIDDSGTTELRFFTEIGGTADIIQVMNLGDNSVQTIEFEKTGIERFEVAFGGSGGIANFDAVPCPRLVNFDERTLGAPLELEVGEEITDQFADIGLTIEAQNNVPGHPDKCILFDTANPTGGDTDLVTPGYGVDNDTALGKVLIVAENDVDTDMDGLVDDPDDEDGGGDLQFRFDTAVDFMGAVILDVDGSEFDAFNLYDENDNLILFVPIPAMGDNSVQTLTLNPPVPGVHRAELVLAGSGAVTALKYCPSKVTPPL